MKATLKYEKLKKNIKIFRKFKENFALIKKLFN